jgi:dTDP-glucose 4,6-dehydratase
MKILVTGAAGFIGSHFARTLLSEGGHEVTVLDKLTYAGNPANLDPVRDCAGFAFVHGDVADAELVNELVKDHEAVVHFAAETHVDRSIAGADDFIVTNVLGTQRLLDAALRYGAEPFIFISTDEVYGSIGSGSWDEAEPLRPSSPYSASKAAADLLAESYHHTHGMDVRILRPSNNYGPYQFPEKLIPLFITSLLRGEKVPLYGDGGNVRNWMHVDDTCQAVRLVLERGRAGQVYNVGSHVELTNRELVGMLLKGCGASWDMVEKVPDRLGHDRRYSVDWTKARTELGYQPRHDLTVSLHQLIDWYGSNHGWWEPLREALR